MAAIGQQNLQVAAGQIGQQPVPRGQQFQLTINTLGRLITRSNSRTSSSRRSGPVVPSGGSSASNTPMAINLRLGEIHTDRPPAGQAASIVRLRDVAPDRAWVATVRSILHPRWRALRRAFDLPVARLQRLADRRGRLCQDAGAEERFPEGLDYHIVYDTTPFIHESVNEVLYTLRDAMILVAIVVLVFLQNWRAALIPLIAVPVSIVGTFAVMSVLGFSLNNLTLFGLVLAIGIVVDDAIVVVENVERLAGAGPVARDAARKAMDEVTGPVIAVALVLCAVFVPCAFLGGITGQFFRQFAVTIAVSTAFSAFNSLTLSPALAAILLKPRGAAKDPLTRLLDTILGWFFRLFNKAFGAGTALYVRGVSGLLRFSVAALVVYCGLLALTYFEFRRVPAGFIPQQDKGYLLVNVQLPDAASVERTRATMSRIEKIALETDGVQHTVGIAGQSLVLNANAPNLGSMYVMLKDFSDAARRGPRRRRHCRGVAQPMSS